MMKQFLALASLALIGLACEKEASLSNQTQNVQTSPDEFVQESASNGNSHDYQLNIIGVPKDKEADMDNNSGRRIFVRLHGGETVTNGGGKWKEGKGWADLDKINKILLEAGDYQVLDANATDDDGALFRLPDPNPEDSEPPAYHVKARALGTPGGSATITTCAEENFDGSTDIWCGSNGVTIERKGGGKGGGGKPEVVDVTENLLKLVISVDPDLDPDLAACLGYEDTPDVDDPIVEDIDVWLFDPCFENYFWNYDNNGLKLLQLRFYAAN